MISTIIHCNYGEIRDWCTNKSELKTPRWGASYGDQKIKCIQALAWWDTDLTLRGKHIFLAYLDSTLTVDFIDEAKLDYKDEKKDPYIEKLYKFSRSKWVAWGEMVYTYFVAMKIIQGVPLTYLLCKTSDPSSIFIDKEQKIIQNSPLHGNMFSRDTKNFLAILKELTLDTDYETCIKGKRCVLESMLTLHHHYYVKLEGERRKQVTNDNPKRLFYRNKTTFSF